VSLRRRGGRGSATLLSTDVGAGARLVAVRPAALRLKDGPYALAADLTPADASPPSPEVRPLMLDRTLAALRLPPVAVRRGRLAPPQPLAELTAAVKSPSVPWPWMRTRGSAIGVAAEIVEPGSVV